MDKVLLLADMQEKKEGHGEDSEPILFYHENSILLGVFDGMGGAGGSECESEFSHDGIHMTKAYVASRIVRDAIEKAVVENPHILNTSNLSDKLISIIEERYEFEKKAYPSKTKTGLISSLIKEYPTTLAVVCITKGQTEFNLDSFWAGDSRNYLWTREGLFQISLDDLKGSPDPMQNLRQDAPLSNCVHADGSFHINHKHLVVSDKDKFIIIAATDGCFGYWRSPMDFEKVIHDTLQTSSSIEEWSDILCKTISLVSADDFSYACAAVGFKDFAELKAYMGKPSKLVKDYFEKVNYNQREIKKAEEKINKMKAGLELSANTLWPKYKNKYLKYLNNNEER